MHLSSGRAIYSAILSTEATANFMFQPSWNGSMITNPKWLTSRVAVNLDTIHRAKFIQFLNVRNVLKLNYPLPTVLETHPKCWP